MSPLEDVLNLIEKLGKEDDKIIVVLDEFQDIFRINAGLDRMLRSVMQNHKNINYVLMGSSESMIREIFEKKDRLFTVSEPCSRLERSRKKNSVLFLEYNFTGFVKEAGISFRSILKITGSHPYYTQQLAFMVWELLNRQDYFEDIAEAAADEIVTSHDNDFELLWNTLNRTDMMVLDGMSAGRSLTSCR